MKYFCKYLPVEGEIKEGSIVKTMGESMSSYKEGEMPSNKRAYQLYKLFLCSRDFKVGSIKTNIETGKETLLENEAMVSLACMQQGILVVKVGEISPEATFVKENDEFSEEQVAYCHSMEDNPDEFILIKDWSLWISNNPYIGKGYKNLQMMVNIKCPCCDKFC